MVMLMPSEIIPLLYIGNRDDSIHFQGVVIDCLFTEGELREEILEGLLEKIHRYRGQGIPVMAACENGIDRSPTVVMWYLVRKLGMSRDEAIKLIKQKRPVANPHPEWQIKKSVKIVDDKLIEKQKHLFLWYDTGLSVDHAIQLGKQGHTVHYFIEYRTRYPRIEDFLPGYGFKEIHKVFDYGEVLDSVETIVFVDVGFGSLADLLRKKGYAVFGASAKGELLELDRIFMLREFEKLGIAVPKHQIVRGVDNLFKAVGSGDKYVKLNIFRGNFETMYVKTPSELKVDLEFGNFGVVLEDMDFIVTEPVKGVEVGVDTFFNGKEFLRPLNEGNECFDGQTEILTNRGWVRFDELEKYLNTFSTTMFDENTEILTKEGWKKIGETEGLKVLTMNLESGECSFVPIKRFIKYYHEGEMFSYETEAFNFLVTLDHKFYVRKHADYWRHDGKGERDEPRPWREMAISEIAKARQPFYVPRVVSIKRDDVEKIKIGDKVYPMDEFLRFLAWFIAEGCVVWREGLEYNVRIVQKEGWKAERITEILDKLGLKYKVYKHGENKQQFYISGVELVTWLKDNCYVNGQTGSLNKKLPDFMRMLSPRQLQLFLDEYVLGDGHREANGRVKMFSASKRLVDDLHEIALLSGRFANVFERDEVHWKGRTGKLYWLNFARRPKERGWLIEPKKLKRISYRGYVYDVEVEPYHTIYVRRNGVAFWSSNCKGTGAQFNRYVDSSEIWDDVLEKLEPWLAESGYRGALSLEGIYDGLKVTVLDVTARLFFPGSSIYPAVLENYADVIYAVARGEDAKPRFSHKYYSLVTMSRGNADKWTKINFPPELAWKNVFVPRGAVFMNGEYWSCPGDPIVATIVGRGNTFDESVAELESVAEKVEGRECEIGIEGIWKYRKNYLTKLKEFGISW